MIVGLPFELGSGSCGDEGAWEPTSGAELTGRAGGVFHELSSCWNVMGGWSF